MLNFLLVLCPSKWYLAARNSPVFGAGPNAKKPGRKGQAFEKCDERSGGVPGSAYRVEADYFQISIPERLAAPPVVVTLMVPSVTLALKGPSFFQLPAAPLL